MLGALPNSRHDVGSDDDDRDAARLGIRFQAPAHTNHLDGPLTACRFVNDEAGGTERQLVDLALGIVIVNQDYRGHLASRTIRQVSRRFKTEKVFSAGAGGGSRTRDLLITNLRAGKRAGPQNFRWLRASARSASPFSHLSLTTQTYSADTRALKFTPFAGVESHKI